MRNPGGTRTVIVFPPGHMVDSTAGGADNIHVFITVQIGAADGGRRDIVTLDGVECPTGTGTVIVLPPVDPAGEKIGSSRNLGEKETATSHH